MHSYSPGLGCWLLLQPTRTAATNVKLNQVEFAFIEFLEFVFIEFQLVAELNLLGVSSFLSAA